VKQSAVNHIIIIVVMGLIAFAQTYLLLAWEKSAIGFLTLVAALLTLNMYLVTILNIRVLIPRLLLHGRYWAYLFSLLGFVAVAICLDLIAEYWLVIHYHTPVGKAWYLAKGNWAFLKLPSSIVAYFIGFVGTGIVFFLHLWNRSGEQLENLKKQSTHNELEKLRMRIDSEALFDTLDKAAGKVVQFPAEVSALLMDLSKSLREQLYESRQRQLAMTRELPEQAFNLSSPVLEFLTAKRYRLWRHLLMILWFAMSVSPNFHGSLSSLLFDVMVPLAVYIISIYFNVYVLIPKLMMRGKKITYFVATSLLFLAFLVLLVSSRMINIDEINGISPVVPTFFIIANAIRLSFPIFGVCAVCLFQYWVRNQRRIAELETASMLLELEQLQHQVNPHFLFNMLNNILVLTKTNPDEAAVVLHKLSDMLKYQFHEFTKQSIRLGDDIQFLTDYLNLEKLRRDSFEFTIAIDKGVENISLPPLLFITFVENAVKHGNDNRSPSFIKLHFSLDGDICCFSCVNSKPTHPMRKEEVGGLGLPNVRRRLELLYGKQYNLDITENEETFSVKLSIKIQKI
jgi:sensor histidine kinase YesM